MQNVKYFGIVRNKILRRQKLGEVASRQLTRDVKTDKDKLIESNEKQTSLLNIASPNPLLERTKERNKSLQLFVNKSEKYLRKSDPEKEKYFKIYVDNYSLPESRSFVNKRIEPKEIYSKAIETQIKNKQEAILKEKFLEDKAVSEINQQINISMSKDEAERKRKANSMKSAIYEGNKLLISLKKSKEEVINILRIYFN